MKKIILTYTAFTILMILSGKIDAQTEFDRLNKYAVPSITAKFHEASFSEPELCTGKIKYDLSFHTIPFKDIEIPIGISYCSNGIQLKSIASRVGQEWSLIAGGAVTRKKRGSQRDYENYYVPYPIEKQQSGWQYADSASTDGYLDGEPDIMVVNAPGLYSEFIIDRADEAHVLDGQKIKIEVDHGMIDLPNNDVAYCPEITIYYTRDSITDIKKLTITNELGYKYTFDYLAWNALLIFVAHEWEISSWYLSKIESPYGQDVTFTYDENGKAAVAPVHTEILEAVASNYYTDDLYFANPQGYVSSRNITVNNKLRLKGIAFDGGTIDFNYNLSRSDISGDYALSEILIKDNSNTTVKKVNLSYSYFTDGGTNTRLKLTKAEIKSPDNNIKDEYQFDYYPGDVPNRFSYEYDYFGYYNANNASDWSKKVYAYYGVDLRNTTFLPFLKTGDYVLLDSNGADRSPAISSRNGMLKKITLPTGGYQEFFYELNTWQSNNIPGLRLKQETLYDGIDSTKINFEYGESYVHFPKIACLIEYKDPILDPMNDAERRTFITNYTARFAYDQMNNEFFDGSSIIYSYVKKYQQNNGYTIYCYQAPEDPELDFETEGNFQTLSVNPSSGFPFCIGESYKNHRGKLIEEAYVDANNYLKRIIAYKYGYTSFGGSLHGHIRKQVGTSYDIIKCQYDIHQGKYALSGMIEATPPSGFSADDLQYGYNFTHLEDDNDSRTCNFLKQKTYYRYNSYGLLANICKIQSDGTELSKIIGYPIGINSTIYNNMVAANMINYPIEVYQGVGLEQVTQILNGELNTYKLVAGSYAKDKTYFMNISSPVPNDFSFNGTTINSYFSTDNTITYNSYNSNGDITKYTTKNGITVHYLWGYNNTYPVAKIESQLSTDISSTVKNNIAANAFSYSDDLTYINQNISYLETQLSSYINNPSYKVSLYTYKPLVGLTSTTDPAGITTYHQYDDFGRLESIKDDDQKLLNGYVYNYAH